MYVARLFVCCPGHRVTAKKLLLMMLSPCLNNLEKTKQILKVSIDIVDCVLLCVDNTLNLTPKFRNY